MKRFTYPTFINCNPPRETIQLKDNRYKLPIDLKKAFHHTYVDVHGRTPKRGTNPIFNEYEPLLDNSEDLRFSSPGIADDTESKIGESRKLGRGIARYILSEYYGYTWFGKIQSLLTNSQDGWKVERPSSGGDTPDWLLSDGNSKHCIGEAKGTHGRIDTDSELVKKWRKQCTNIVVKKDNRKKKLKSWLIATRFVNENTPDLPEQLIEDPFIEGDEMNDNDFPSLNRIIVMDHLSSSLYRLSNFRLGLKVQQDASLKDGFNRVMTWRPIIKELSHLTFIGRPIGNFAHNLSIWDWAKSRPLKSLMYFRKGFGDLFEMFGADIFFDGIAVDSVRNYFNRNYLPPELGEYDLGNYSFVSLLNDGNIIIPMSLMQPDKIIDL